DELTRFADPATCIYFCMESENIWQEVFGYTAEGKARYFRSQRVEMYKLIADELTRFADPATCIYFCMESENIWQEVFGYTAEEKGGLRAMLDRSVQCPCS
ncbi:MAG: hypothetical protein D3924_11725, partial [Candidatus Electrothrix sp. AR4]|nr:hypothetical protein [Candidatus Electrothrix sp. AR4]